jgi:hypothetical protein
LLASFDRPHRAARRRRLGIERIGTRGGDELAELFDPLRLERAGLVASAFSSAS